MRWKRLTRWCLGLLVALAGMGALPTTPAYAEDQVRLETVGDWSVSALQLSSEGDALTTSVPWGQEIDVRLVLEPGSDNAGLRYNFGWRFGDTWDEWDSLALHGAEQADATWSFRPTKVGRYYVFADAIAPDGRKETLDATIEVDKGWSFDGLALDKTSPQYVDTDLALSVQVSGVRSKAVVFNYVWQRDNWADWSSTVKETGEHVTERSHTYTFTHSGDYTLYVDCHDQETGQTWTYEQDFRVNKTWNLERLDLSYETPLYIGGGVYGTAVVSGDTAGLKYNFVWERDGWADWNSNLRAGSYTSSSTMSWVPIAVSGTYSFAVDVVDAHGEQQTVSVGGVVVGSPVRDRMTSMAQGYASNTSWLIMIDTTNNYLGIYRGGRGAWNLDRFWICSTGAPATPTVLGEYTVKAKGYSFGHGYTCYYYTQFYGDYLIHSVKYYQGTFNVLDGRMGMNISEGCIRLPIDQAKWIWDNVPTGTKVVTYR